MITSADSDKVFLNPNDAGIYPVGWYYRYRKGLLYGPYATDGEAIEASTKHVETQ